MQIRLPVLKYMEAAKRSELRWEREKGKSRRGHGLTASPRGLAWRGGGGFSDRFTAEAPFRDPERYYKQKADEAGTKEAELLQGVVGTTDTCLHLGCSSQDRCSEVFLKLSYAYGLYGSEKDSEIATGT